MMNLKELWKKISKLFTTITLVALVVSLVGIAYLNVTYDFVPTSEVGQTFVFRNIRHCFSLTKAEDGNIDCWINQGEENLKFVVDYPAVLIGIGDKFLVLPTRTVEVDNLNRKTDDDETQTEYEI